MTFDRDRKFVDYDAATQSIIDQLAADKAVEDDASSQGEAPSPSESALSEFRIEYARRVKEAFCCETDS